ncbi:MAG: hypothetical protein FT672_02400 [Pantoea sp. Edef]|nr:hypothetical protein [Pantoea sp. Edef]
MLIDIFYQNFKNILYYINHLLKTLKI